MLLDITKDQISRIVRLVRILGNGCPEIVGPFKVKKMRISSIELVSSNHFVFTFWHQNMEVQLNSDYLTQEEADILIHILEELLIKS